MTSDRDYQVTVDWKPYRKCQTGLRDVVTRLTYREAERIADIYRKNTRCLNAEIRLGREV